MVPKLLSAARISSRLAPLSAWTVMARVPKARVLHEAPLGDAEFPALTLSKTKRYSPRPADTARQRDSLHGTSLERAGRIQALTAQSRSSRCYRSN